MKHILVATDFSPAAENALNQAATIAQKAGIGVVLFHVNNSHTDKLMAAAGELHDHLATYMARLCEEITVKFGIECKPVVYEGSIFSEIPKEADDPDCVMLAMGTHGSQGIRQKLFGADMLKISRKSPAPVLAVPGKALKGPEAFDRILFPYGGHENFDAKVHAVTFLAETLGSEVILYTIDRFAGKVSDPIRKQMDNAIAAFDEKNIRHSTVKDEATTFSVGFANQTLAYAKANGIHLISVMSSKSDNLSFITEVDLEALINNDAGICILLTGEQ